MGPFAVLFKEGCNISQKETQVGLKEMGFQRLLHSKAKNEEITSSTISTYFSDFFPPQKLLHAFSNASQALISAASNLRFEIGVFKKLIYLRTDGNAFFYLGLTCAWKFLPYKNESFAFFFLFIAFRNILINQRFV
jgi:hypothetical protein